MNASKTVNLSSAGHLKPTRHAKRMIAEAMYMRGKSFLGAAVLLQQKGGHEYVVLHLLCQGIEIVMKALLLLADFDKYQPKLQKRYGHNLEKLAIEVSKVFALHSLKPALRNELSSLSFYFSKHLLRYAGIQDIFLAAGSIERDRVFRRMVAVLRMVERELARGKASQAVSPNPKGRSSER
jgi:hypothetical protein